MPILIVLLIVILFIVFGPIIFGAAFIGALLLWKWVIGWVILVVVGSTWQICSIIFKEHRENKRKAAEQAALEARAAVEAT